MLGILLDLDDTLLDDRAATTAGFAAFAAAHRHDLPDRPQHELLATWRTLALRHWLRHEAGELSFIEQRRERIREFLGRPLSDAEADAAAAPYLRAYEAAWRLFPDVAEFLERTRAVPKVIVTNGDRAMQLRKLEATGLAAHVTAVITPDCGHWKPALGIFHVALAALSADAARCLMIGDDPVRDIEPARQLGMRHFLVPAAPGARRLTDAL